VREGEEEPGSDTRVPPIQALERLSTRNDGDVLLVAPTRAAEPIYLRRFVTMTRITFLMTMPKTIVRDRAHIKNHSEERR